LTDYSLTTRSILRMASVAPKSDIRGSVAGSLCCRSYRFHDFGFKRSVFFDFTLECEGVFHINRLI
jgi:hypothetical protein